jgi:hypothetical protein
MATSQIVDQVIKETPARDIETAEIQGFSRSACAATSDSLRKLSSERHEGSREKTLTDGI